MNERNAVTLTSFAVFGLLFFSGCGNGGGGKVTGAVTFKGKPVVSGTVMFHYADGGRNDARIVDGSYTMDNVKPGAVRITIESPKPGPPRGKEGTAAGPDPSKWFPIDVKYAHPDTSGKEATIKGNDKVDINLD
jgi:hypothetical protein